MFTRNFYYRPAHIVMDILVYWPIETSVYEWKSSQKGRRDKKKNINSEWQKDSQHTNNWKERDNEYDLNKKLAAMFIFMSWPDRLVRMIHKYCVV